MKKQLHILKSASDTQAISMIEELSRSHAPDMTVVLIQDGVKVRPKWKARTFILKDGPENSIPVQNGVEAIHYHRLVDLIFEADTVVGW